MRLSALNRHCFLHSDERRESYDRIAEELCDYKLRWRGGAVDAVACKAEVGQLSLYAMGYGDEVDIEPAVYGDFTLVHLSLRQGIEIESDDVRVSVPQGRIFLSSPRRTVRLRWQQNCQQLILRVPNSLLSEASLLDPALLPAGSLLGIAQLLPARLQPQWLAQLNLLLAISEQEAQQPAHAQWVRHVERGVASFLALQLGVPNHAAAAAATAPGESRPMARQRALQRMERLEDYVRSRLMAPLTIEDLAREANLSRSQLNQVCREIVGSSPMHWLRDLRLDAARAHLLLNPGAEITETALRFGFEHLGRFSQYYRERFSELPRDTRATSTRESL